MSPCLRGEDRADSRVFLVGGLANIEIERVLRLPATNLWNSIQVSRQCGMI